MPLLLPPSRYKALYSLVETFNTVPENDKVQQLFYLQQINYILNRLSYDQELFDWVHSQEENSWGHHLSGFDINPYASFFLKGHQFALAVTKHDTGRHQEDAILEGIEKSPSHYTSIYYEQMQERDALFSEEKNYQECSSEYINISFMLKGMSEASSSIQSKLDVQQQKLQQVQEKIECIIYNKKRAGGDGYKVKELGEHVNNYNFILTKDEWDEDLIARVEDREDWKEEQTLNTYPVSQYFIEDYAGFMMAFKDNGVKPVVISQRAKQGSLQAVAQELKEGKPYNIPSQTEHYFLQLIDFCKKLIESGHYHPDIKLTNFLVDRNVIRVSDRKTIIKEKNPLMHTISTSPLYAPPEFVNCLNFLNGRTIGFKISKRSERANMDAFMAYQLGMALKEFLILTQMDAQTEKFEDPTVEAASYFKSPSNAIVNYSILIQELTRENPEHRLSISNLQKLLSYRNHSPKSFYIELEKILPSANIGIQDELDQITRVLNSEKNPNEWLEEANQIFENIDNRNFKEPRLNHKAKELALKCFSEYSKHVLKQYVDAIEAEVLQHDWNEAPWYRKLLQVVSFGVWRVERKPVADFRALKIKLDLNDDQFKRLLPHLSFMEVSDLYCFGKKQAHNFYNYLTSHADETKSASESSPLETLSLIGERGSQSPDGTFIIHGNTESTSPDGTFIIHGNTESTSPDGTFIIHGNTESTCPDGTFIIHGNTESTSPGEQVVSAEGNTQSHIANAASRVSTQGMFGHRKSKLGTGLDSVRTTMKRNGSVTSGSFRFRDIFKPPTKKPDLPSVTFNPESQRESSSIQVQYI